MRPKAMRCSACGTTNPLHERTSLEGRIGLRGTVALLVVASVILVVLSVWMIVELVALGQVNPLLLGAWSLMLVVGVGVHLARRFRP